MNTNYLYAYPKATPEVQ